MHNLERARKSHVDLVSAMRHASRDAQAQGRRDQGVEQEGGQVKSLIFSGESVRAIMAGTKTQTRRVMKPQPTQDVSTAYWFWEGPRGADLCWMPDEEPCHLVEHSPYPVGGIARVKETFSLRESDDGWLVRYADGTERVARCDVDPWSDDSFEEWTKRNPIYMPAWASRLFLRITAVRAERLQDITEEDAIAEGIPRIPDSELVCHCGSYLDSHSFGDGHSFTPMPEHRHEFSLAWDRLNGKRSPWARNDWVWALTFERVESHDAR